MKRIWKITLSALAILAIGIGWFLYNPADIKPAYLGDILSEKDIVKGQTLMQEMQAAYGGMDKWTAYKTASFSQEADWYEDKLGMSGWGISPQLFEMTSNLGTDESELTLMNGDNKGQTWGIQDWKTYQKKHNGEKDFLENGTYESKLVFKNYWFQFPFRISEAPIVAYAGESTVEGETYDLLYATWGSATANREYDQYVLYLDQETRLVEWLHFTIRDKAKFANSSTHFTDFKTINGIVAPYSQYITLGSPESDGRKLHENRYKWIQFGEEKVMR